MAHDGVLVRLPCWLLLRPLLPAKCAQAVQRLQTSSHTISADAQCDVCMSWQVAVVGLLPGAAALAAIYAVPAGCSAPQSSQPLCVCLASAAFWQHRMP